MYVLLILAVSSHMLLQTCVAYGNLEGMSGIFARMVDDEESQSCTSLKTHTVIVFFQHVLFRPYSGQLGWLHVI